MSSLTLSFEHEGQVARVALATPKANIVNQAMIAALAAAFEDLRNRPQLKVMILTAEGLHFSFGASVQEHLPEHVRNMLPRFSALLGQMLELPPSRLRLCAGSAWAEGLSWPWHATSWSRRTAPSSRVPKSSWPFSRLRRLCYYHFGLARAVPRNSS